MPDIPGKFQEEWHDCDRTCASCHIGPVRYCTWESSDGAFEDIHYVCQHCGNGWWVDGCDS